MTGHTGFWLACRPERVKQKTVIPKGEAKSLSSRTSEARRDLVFDSGFLNPEIPPLRGRDPFVQNDKHEVTDAALGSLFFEQDISTNAYRFVHP